MVLLRDAGSYQLSFFFQDYENKFQLFEQEELSNLQKKCDALIKECDEKDGARLKSIVDGKILFYLCSFLSSKKILKLIFFVLFQDEIKKTFKELYDKIHPEKEKLENIIKDRQNFEREIEAITVWLSDCESAINAESNADSLNGFQNELEKVSYVIDLNYKSCRVTSAVLIFDFIQFVRWEKDGENIGARIDELVANSSGMKLNNMDSITVADKLSVLRMQYLRILNSVKEHSSYLTKMLEKYKHSQKKIDDSIQLIQKVQEEMQKLNQPLGRNVEDVFERTAGYQVMHPF